MELYPTSPVVLDGGLGTTLEALAQNAKTPLWSTQPILDNPNAIVEVHSSFLRAGARIILTATYQASLDTFKASGYNEVEAKKTMMKAVHLANNARDSFIKEHERGAPIVKIALSLGPFGATLSPPQEFDGYYPPPYGPMGYSKKASLHHSFNPEDLDGEQKSIDALAQFHLERLLLYARDVETWRMIDIIAFETVPLLREALAIRKAMAGLKNVLAAEGVDVEEKPWWISFVLPSGRCPQKSSSGHHRTIEDVVHSTMSCDLNDVTLDTRLLPTPTGIGINCTALEFIPGLLREFTLAIKQLNTANPGRPWLVLYPDGGDVYDIMTRSWLVASEDIKHSWATDLKNAVTATNNHDDQSVWGGLVVGGCCRTGPDLIQRLNEQLHSTNVHA